MNEAPRFTKPAPPAPPAPKILTGMLAARLETTNKERKAYGRPPLTMEELKRIDGE